MPNWCKYNTEKVFGYVSQTNPYFRKFENIEKKVGLIYCTWVIKRLSFIPS